MRESVKDFYNKQGWSTNDAGQTQDAVLWEDLRNVAQDYVRECRLRVRKTLPDNGALILDAASGPVQYPEYLEYSKGFEKRFCVDISERALASAREKLKDHGDYICASLTELPFEDNKFDAAVSLHTIYHIEKTQQEKAVHELLRVTKRGAPIAIVYANPDRFFSAVKRVFKKPSTPEAGVIYYHAWPLDWWKRFEHVAEISFSPWRSLTAQDSKRLFPNNEVGKVLLNSVLRLEERFPKFFTRWGAYPLIVLKKR